MKKFKKRHPLYYYFKNIADGIISTYSGMKLTFSYIFKKPETIEYPEQPILIPDGYRGVHTLDKTKCIVCKSCQRACPTSCITIESNGVGKNADLTKFEVDYTKCLFCGLCSEVCVLQVVKLSPTPPVVVTDKKDITISLL
ncbi:MAG: 4Fe-4S binding protein [Deltaproteobacteria bacterium]|jgi:formate hydrogenlyase subunit 6/NADH:ubiquinone oxidoreductase subunit I|nr:4Fe-4S binding protein [Deltaproteobacteria bacterium]